MDTDKILDLEFQSRKLKDRSDDDVEKAFRYVSDLLDIRCELADKIKDIDEQLDHLIDLCKGNYKGKL